MRLKKNEHIELLMIIIFEKITIYNFNNIYFNLINEIIVVLLGCHERTRRVLRCLAGSVADVL